jgi:predicted short-subunit dehydrogenase-like oxidoreductase (DUF2520 family)
MKIGFIGAGKVGFTLGKYFTEQNIVVSGFYNRHPEVAIEAAEFTGTRYYDTMENLIRDSEVIFITVPDNAIAEVWEQLKQLQVKDKIICHCSGALSSAVFSDITNYECYGYSIHPLFAVNSKTESYKELSRALFTIEGNEIHREQLADIVRACGNKVVFLNPEHKVRYHCAAVFASNLINGIMETAVAELVQCGFEPSDALEALAPLSINNVEHLEEGSLEAALTGPVERGDTQTVKKHIDNISGDSRAIYILLSKRVLQIAKRKNPERDYRKMEELLNG